MIFFTYILQKYVCKLDFTKKTANFKLFLAYKPTNIYKEVYYADNHHLQTTPRRRFPCDHDHDDRYWTLRFPFLP